MKTKFKPIIPFILSLLLAMLIFGDWENFKAGISGKPPVTRNAK